MPSAHRNAIKKLLEALDTQITHGEARLLEMSPGEEMSNLVEQIAGLHLRRQELMDALSDGGWEKVGRPI